MIRVVSMLVLGMSCSILTAADQYASPPHPATVAPLPCIIDTDIGYPTSAINANGTDWDVTAQGKYNYENTWSFKELEVRVDYIKFGANPRLADRWTETSEAKLTTAGSYSKTFSKISPPNQGETLFTTATIRVSKAGQQDQSTYVYTSVPLAKKK